MIFIFPTEKEASAFRESCPTAHIEICGVGMAACAATIASLAARGLGEEGLVLAGVAGCYPHSELAMNQVVEVISEEICSLPQRFGKRYTVAQKTTLRAVSSNCVNHSNESTLLGSETQMPEIENMEGAALFAICAELGIEATEIRAISNQVGAPFEQWSINKAIKALADTLMSHCEPLEPHCEPLESYCEPHESHCGLDPQSHNSSRHCGPLTSLRTRSAIS